MTVTLKRSVMTEAQWVRKDGSWAEDEAQRKALVFVPEGASGETLETKQGGGRLAPTLEDSVLVEVGGVLSNGAVREVRVWVPIQFLKKAKR